MRAPILLVLLSATVLASGCATVTRGTTQAWTADSEPLGADVTLSTGERCKTPCTLTRKRKQGFSVHFEKDGYEPVDAEVVSQVGGSGAVGMAGNLLVGGLIGMGVDAATGATKELKPNPLYVKMVPSAKTADPEPQAAEAAPASESP